jgi:hypothetical protein
MRQGEERDFVSVVRVGRKLDEKFGHPLNEWGRAQASGT